MRFLSGVVLALISFSFAFGQSSPEFEVASIRPAAPLVGQAKIGLHLDGAQVNCNSLSIRDYIDMAYKLKPYQVVGPDWIASDRFDISAKLPEGSKPEQIPEMLQALMGDRFRMTVHHAQKEFPVYALLPGKGELKLRESPADSDSPSADAGRGNVNVAVSGGPAGVNIDLGKGSSFSMANDRFEGRRLTMPTFADTLGRFLDRPAVDMTGLKGSYDFTMEFAPDDFRAMIIRSAIYAGVSLPAEALRALDSVSGDSLFAAIEGLGLKLDRRKAPIDVLVIDHIEKRPTEN